MRLTLALTLASLAALAAWPAAANELQRCRAIAEPAARLACYDALAAQPVPAAPASPAAAAAPAAAKPAVDPVAGFGFENRLPAEAPDTITSHLPGRFEGWGGTTMFRLANGQVWQVIDGSSAFYWLENPKVTLRRAMMGTFFLEIEGAARAPRVKRLQ
jgi:hypothetical protein